MRRTVTRTVRIDEGLDRSIQRIAADESITINSLVGRSLTRLVEWDRPAQKFGYVAASSILLGKLLSDKDEDRCEELGRWAAHEFVIPFVVFLFGELSCANVLLFFKRASRYGQFAFDETEDSGKHILVLKQTHGPNWSYYYGGMMKEMFQAVLGKKFATDHTSGILVAQLDTS